MDENLTEIVFLLDRSGSMRNLVDDTIGGFNSFIESQKKEPGKAKLTTVLFSNGYQILHDGIDINNVKELDEKTYSVSGTTALYDAIGIAINSVGKRLANTPEENRPSKVIFVITTDGQENSSKEFDHELIKNMIEHQTEKYNWNFLFLGANIDAMAVGSGMGISYNTQYTADSYGTQRLYSAVTKTVSNYRSSGTIKQDWDKDIQ